MADKFDEVLQLLSAIETRPPFWHKTAYDVYIYGTGTFGRDVYRALTERGVPVQGFLDHIERDEPFYCGAPVFLPAEPVSAGSKAARAVVLATHNPFADIVEIHKNLNAFGYQRIITPVELFDYLGDALGDRYWLTSRTFYRSLSTVLEQAYKLWSDQTSRTIFSKIIEHRLTGDYSILPQPDRKRPYAPDDIPAWQSPIRMIDCGAFDGDSLQDILKSEATFESLAAFEPDSATFHKLKTFIAANSDNFPNSTLWPCGVYSSTTQLRFNANLGVSSRISKRGDEVIQCIAIDDALPNFQPTLIKMDIEGAEYDALLGAKKTIRAHKPGLAISVYHTPEHLWQIPLLVDRLAKSQGSGTQKESTDYDYFLRSHSMNGYDLVFYAVTANHNKEIMG